MKEGNKMTRMIIYGAGVYAKRVVECYKIKGLNIERLVVSDKTNIKEQEYDGIPIISIQELLEEDLEDTSIIVATDARWHEEIRIKLDSSFGRDVLEKAVFYSKRDIDELFRETHPFLSEDFIKSTEPVSRLFGNERGTPVDRYYIEQYLERESKEITLCDRVLEVGEDTYSKRFFPNSESDILDYSMGMDLTKKETLPESRYDVFICTQVLHQIYDVKSAIEGAYYLLKEGGVLLATVCGNISKLARNDEYEHYWGFTECSLKKIVGEVFEKEIKTEFYGNSAVATAFVQGISLEELDKAILNKKDKDFTICISVTAKK